MRAILTVGFAALLVPLSSATSANAAPTAGAALPCVRTTIAARKSPSGPAQYESGSLKLANGASMRLQGTPAEMNRVRAMAVGDDVAACYGPPKNYADAGPARTITVLDLVNGEYYANLVGTWKRR